jgi:preprotein translocase subunit SecG
MITVIVTIHLILAVAVIGVVLLQKSEGGALGMGGGGMSGFMTGRSTANLLTRTTAVLVALFFITSIGLAVLASHQRAPRSLIDQPGTSGPISPTTLPPGPAGPATPAEPSVPLTK